MADVTIIGAGVAGLFAAHVLVQRGLTPRILDRNGAPGPHGCSWCAGGMLAPQCEGVTADPSLHTGDLGGKAKTADVTAAVCAALAQGAQRQAA